VARKLEAGHSRLGKINRMKAGFWMGGPPPFGYKIEGKKLVSNPEESKWVQFIFKSYCDGQTVQKIRMQLMENGVKTRRNNSVWSFGSIEALLTNTHYSGHYVVRDKKTGENIRCSCPSILSPTLSRETARKKELRSKRRVRESNQKHFYLLRDFLVCDHCESRFSGRTYAKQYRSTYYCPRKERNFVNSGTEKEKKCTNSRYLKIAETDDLVWQTVVKVLSNSAQFKEWFKKDTLGAMGSHEDRAVEVSRLQKQLKSLDAEIRHISETLTTLETDRLIRRRTPEEVERIMTDIEKHRVDRRAIREETEGKIHALVSKQKWINWITEFGERINRMSDFTPNERHELLGRVVKEIRVRTLGIRSHRLTIKFNLPYHGDRFDRINPKDHSKGYSITAGKDSFDVTVTDAKKNN
jgi:site-specific DNA recombinase